MNMTDETNGTTRRGLITTGAMAAALAVTLPALAAQQTSASTTAAAGGKSDCSASGPGMITVKDGTQIF